MSGLCSLPAALLLVNLCLTSAGHVGHHHILQSGGGLNWPAGNLWNKLLYIRRDSDRQQGLLHSPVGDYPRGNHTYDVPTRLELDVSGDGPSMSAESEQPRRAAARDHRERAIAEAIGPYITPIGSTNISAVCRQTSEAYLKNIGKQLWALTMFDATGKMPDGILGGNLNAWGNWDECLNITAEVNVTDTSDAEAVLITFTGKYCMTLLTAAGDASTAQVHSPQMNALGLAPILPYIPIPWLLATSAVCMPSTCTGEELALGLNAVLKNVVTVYTDAGMCYTKDEKTEFSSGAIVMISLLSVLALLVLLGTVVDLVAVNVRESDASWLAPLEAGITRALPPTLRRVLLSFSLYTNGRKLLDTSSTSGTVSCLHGIRFLSNTWVILGHSYYFLIFFRHENMMKLFSYFSSVAFYAIANATVSVDSFFLLSGLLVSYVFMRNIERTKGSFNIVMFYVHRYIRLTPVMMLVIGFIATLYGHLGSGPCWGFADLATPQICRDNWWKNMLYINNLVDMDRQCIGQTWYLANDMQMFIFSPLVLLPLYYWPTLGQLWLIFLVCFFTGINAMITAVHRLDMPGGDDDNLRYMKPWARAGPYLVGLYTGWILHKIRDRKIHIPAPVVAIGWLAASLTGCLIVYGMYGQPTVPVKTTNIIYPMLNRTAWGVCLAWVIFACATGYGGFVNTLLSWKAFIPLSRLTYTSFLVSIDTQVYYWYTNKSPVHLDQTFIVYLFLGYLPVIFTVSAMFSLALESPMIALEKIIFPQPSPAVPVTAKPEPAAPLLASGQANAGFQVDDGDASTTVPETHSTDELNEAEARR